MAYKVKGNAGPILQSSRFEYDPETARLYREDTWGGSARAIEGQVATFRNRQLSIVATTEDSGRGQSITRTPLAAFKNPEGESTVRYEIATEFLEQDIFRHKTVSDDADAYDAARAAGDETYRKFAENAVDEVAASITPTQQRVTEHLRKGVTGFEREYIVLRRSRRVPFGILVIAGGGGVPQASILEGRFIYSTAQLGLPSGVAFALPDLSALPTSDWDDVQWGWRRRPSSVVFTGDYIEQTSEFVLAEWSLLTYEVATTSAGW